MTAPATPAPRSGITHVAVVVPAFNEQELIGACLGSITVAVDHLRRGRPELAVDVVVVLDRCTDGTARLVRRWPRVRALTSFAGNVGAARQQGSIDALDRASAASRNVWTAHTDADSAVPEDWLAHHVELVESGAEVVLGTVRPHPADPSLPAWVALHDLRDGHPHVHGANLGVRGDVLRALGGWPSLAEHEDAELVRRAVAARCAIVRTGRCAVRTSSRRTGRTLGGMAGYLRALDAEVV